MQKIWKRVLSLLISEYPHRSNLFFIEAILISAGHTTGFTGGSDCFNAKGGEEFCFISKWLQKRT